MIEELKDYVIECYAFYQAPQQVIKSLREKFGEHIPTYYEVLTARKKYRKQILEKREELETNIPILNSKERWGYLQHILDDCLEEQPIMDRSGEVVGYRKDNKNAITALKLANDMAEIKGSVLNEDDRVIREIVYEAYDKMRLASPHTQSEELIAELIDALGEKVKPFTDDLLERNG